MLQFGFLDSEIEKSVKAVGRMFRKLWPEVSWSKTATRVDHSDSAMMNKDQFGVELG